MSVEIESTTKKRKKNKKSKIITFDNEIITKEDGAKLIKHVPEFEKSNKVESLRKSKKQIIEAVDTLQISSEQVSNPVIKRKDCQESANIPGKKKKKVEHHKEIIEESKDELNTKKLEGKNKESIREQKRKKHAKLLAEKKLKAELAMQQKSLNYLSKWKHSREDWKFEKLRQIWLQQNLFDTNRISKEFWNTTVEYFRGAKGHIRKVVLEEAVKIIDTEESTEEEMTDSDYQEKLRRARDIVQNLQE